MPERNKAGDIEALAVLDTPTSKTKEWCVRRWLNDEMFHVVMMS